MKNRKVNENDPGKLILPNDDRDWDNPRDNPDFEGPEDEEDTFVPITREELRPYEIRIINKPCDTPVRGNVSASGNDREYREVENNILRRLKDGDEWAWCDVKVEIQKHGYVGESSWIGGVNCEDKEDFKNSGYYEDLVEEALENLNYNIEDDPMESLKRKKVSCNGKVCGKKLKKVAKARMINTSESTISDKILEAIDSIREVWEEVGPRGVNYADPDEENSVSPKRISYKKRREVKLIRPAFMKKRNDSNKIWNRPVEDEKNKEMVDQDEKLYRKRQFRNRKIRILPRKKRS